MRKIFVRYEESCKYDGTNAAEVLDYLESDTSGTYSVFTSTPESLTLQYDRPEFAPDYYQVPLNYWLLKDTSGRLSSWISDAEVAGQFKPLPGQGAPKLQTGVGVVPVLAANAQTTVTVNFPEEFADDEFNVTAFTLSGTNPLSPLEIQGEITIVDANTVEVEVKNTGLLSLGGFVVAHAVR